MAKTTTTQLNGKRDISIPYRFTCNYCGHVNHKTLERLVIGTVSRRGSIEANANVPMEQALENQLDANTQKEIRDCQQVIADYAARLRAGTQFQPSEGRVSAVGPYIHTLPFDGVCAACRRRQAWDMEPILKDMPKRPVPEEPKWKNVVRVIALIIAIPVPLALIILSVLTSFLPAKTALIGAVACFLAGSIVAGMLSPNRAAGKRADLEYQVQYLTEKLGAEPNLEENLPVIAVKGEK